MKLDVNAMAEIHHSHSGITVHISVQTYGEETEIKAQQRSDMLDDLTDKTRELFGELEADKSGEIDWRVDVPTSPPVTMGDFTDMNAHQYPCEVGITVDKDEEEPVDNYEWWPPIRLKVCKECQASAKTIIDSIPPQTHIRIGCANDRCTSLSIGTVLDSARDDEDLKLILSRKWNARNVGLSQKELIRKMARTRREHEAKQAEEEPTKGDWKPPIPLVPCKCGAEPETRTGDEIVYVRCFNTECTRPIVAEDRQYSEKRGYDDVCKRWNKMNKPDENTKAEAEKEPSWPLSCILTMCTDHHPTAYVQVTSNGMSYLICKNTGCANRREQHEPTPGE